MWGDIFRTRLTDNKVEATTPSNVNWNIEWRTMYLVPEDSILSVKDNNVVWINHSLPPEPKFVMAIPAEMVNDGIDTDLYIGRYDEYLDFYDKRRLYYLSRKGIPVPLELAMKFSGIKRGAIT